MAGTDLFRRLSPQVVAGVAISAGSTAVAVKALWTPPLDLRVYRAGGQALLAGTPLYAGPVFGGLDFTYPPLAALVFVPLALLPMPVTHLLVTAGNLAALWFVVSRSLRMLGVPPGPRAVSLTLLIAGCLFWVDAVRTTFYLGQVNLALLALLLWDLSRPRERRGLGIGVGIAAGIKLTPLIFVPYLLVTRRFRAAGVAMATFLCTVLLGFVAVPADATTYWLTGTFAHVSRVFPDLDSAHNQSVRGLISRTLGDGAFAASLWLVVVLVLVAGTITLAARASRQGNELLAITLCGMCGVAVPPFSWNHHWVWLVPLAVLLVHRLLLVPAPDRVRWLPAAALFPLTLPWLANLANPPVTGPAPLTGPLAALLDNVYLLIYLATLAAATASPRTSPGPKHARQRYFPGPTPGTQTSTDA
ncbi:MAG TPA: glycosyltransferase 87 family protein [Pseudonocardiaceae bacterium]